MAQAIAETTAPERRAGASAGPPGRQARDPKTGRMLPREAGQLETPVKEEPEGKDPHGYTEAVSPQPPDNDEDDLPETDTHEMPETEEDDAPEEEESTVSRQALIAQRTQQERTKALLSEALRLGLAQGLIERRTDGSFALPGQEKPTRLTSDCTCQACSPQNQRHWWCVVCGSGPHDWLMNKPQYERQTLKAGGIEGARQAACSSQCARDFLSSLGRQPAGVTPSPTIDPTLALP